MQPDTNNEHEQKPVVTQPAETSTVQTESAAESVTAPTKNNTLLYVGIAALALAAVGVFLFMQYGSGSLGKSVMNGDEEAVASVNGEEISKSTFDAQVAQITTSAGQQGIDVENPETQSLIEEQALDTLVNTELLVQGAAGAGITISDEAIEEQFQSIATQIGGEDALRTQISQLGLTEEEVRANIADELAINQYIAVNVDTNALTVSDTEVQAFYDEISAGQEEVPPLETVGGQIEAQLLETKEQDAILALIAELKEVADIELFVF
jgi:FKBP-type peptidyl-prolyl cis-trans isomerase (trigger factor)